MTHQEVFSEVDLNTIADEVEQDHFLSMRWLYKTPQGAARFAALESGASSYGKSVEGLLLAELTAQLIEISGKSRGDIMHMIDFGCGGGSTSTHAIELVMAKGITPVLYPVDISSEMLRSYKNYVEQRLPSIEVHPFELDFSSKELTTELLREIRSSVVSVRKELVGLFTGDAIGNNDTKRMRLLTNIVDGMEANDRLIIGAHLSDVNNPEWVRDTVSRYGSEIGIDFNFSALEYFGVQKDQGSISFEFNKSKSAIEGYFIPHRSIDIKIGKRLVHVAGGTRLQILKTDKTDQDTLKTLLEKIPVKQNKMLISPCSTQAEMLLTRY